MEDVDQYSTRQPWCAIWASPLPGTSCQHAACFVSPPCRTVFTAEVSPASRRTAQRHGPGRVEVAIKLRRDDIPCPDPHGAEFFRPKEVGPSGTDSCAIISRDVLCIQHLYPQSQASRDQAQNRLCQESRSPATHLPAVAQPCSLARSQATGPPRPMDNLAAAETNLDPSSQFF